MSLVHLHSYKQDWYFTNICYLYSFNRQKEEKEAITCQSAQLPIRFEQDRYYTNVPLLFKYHHFQTLRQKQKGQLTGHKKDGRFIGVDLHLTSNPLSVKVCVPHAMLVVVVTELVSRTGEGNLEVALHRILVLLLLLGFRGRRFFRCGEKRTVADVTRTLILRHSWWAFPSAKLSSQVYIQLQ